MPEDTATAPYRFDRQGRSRTTAAILAGIWAALIAAWFRLEASPWILGALALCTLPALRDLVANPAAGLTLGQDTISWHSGPRTAEIAIAEIDHVRLDTRADLSVRATVISNTGRRIRVPPDAMPPHQTFESALNERSVRTERHHFSLRQ